MSERHLTLALALTLLAALPAGVAAQDWRTLTASRAMEGEELLRVKVEYAAGRLEVAPGEPGTLYRASLRYDDEIFDPVAEFQDGHLKLGVGGANIRGRDMKSGYLRAAFSPEVPLELDMAFGAVDADLELGGLRITAAHIATGASRTALRVSSPNPVTAERVQFEVGAAQFEATGLANLRARHIEVSGGVGDVTLDFSGQAQLDTRVSVQMGLGALTLRIPRGLGVRVAKDGFLAGFDSQGLVKRGDAFFSTDWESAPHKLTVDIDAAFGSIIVIWID
jgi:hypothetical protein